jgi:predicted DCC family thiol-disulfide oxidoreductase YuxK
MSARTSNGSVPLPGVESRPDAEVVIYDGFCSFCHAQMRMLHRLDLTGRLAFLSLHDERSNEYLPGMSFEEKMKAIALVDAEGGRYFGAAAFRTLSRRLPLLWWLMPVLHIPGSLGLWQWLYNKVASVRYRFGRRQCDGGTCELHGFGSSGR